MEGDITPLVSSTSICVTPSSCCSCNDLATLGCDGGGCPPQSAIAELPELAGDFLQTEEHRVLVEFQQMVDRYNDCFRCLQAALSDLESLRQENLRLSADNLALTFLIGDLESPSPSTEETADPSTLGGIDAVRGGGGPPKSIAIRSSEFLVANHPQPHRLRLPACPTAAADGEGQSEEGVEVEAYGQGALKTELCNKWGEGGWRCPYGARCRFAHGVEELRPVLRHPRYKTQLCRMLAAPGGCPYGHRCHFRHAALPRDP